MPGLHAVDSGVAQQQAVAVLLFDVVPGVLADAVQRVVLGKVANQGVGENRYVARGRVVLGGRQAVGVDEVRGLHPQAACVLVHDLGEGRLGAADFLGERDGRIVAGLDDHALDEDLGGDLRADLHEGPGALGAPGVLADRDLVGHLEATFLQGLENDVGAHQLGQAGRLHAVIGVILAQHTAAEVIDQHIGPGGDVGRLGNRGGGEGRADGSEGQSHAKDGNRPDHSNEPPEGKCTSVRRCVIRKAAILSRRNPGVPPYSPLPQSARRGRPACSRGSGNQQKAHGADPPHAPTR